MAELYAITWLWDEGFEVFYNAGSTGAVDGKNTNLPSRTPTQKKLGVQFIKFDPCTRKLTLVKHRK